MASRRDLHSPTTAQRLSVRSTAQLTLAPLTLALFTSALSASLLIGCQASKAPPAPQPPSSNTTTSAAPQATSERAWLFVGDSLTAGFGLAPDESYVAELERLLRAQGHTLTLRNAGVSGDTSAGVQRRLSWLLKARPKQPTPSVMFLCIGANDGMRGQPIEALEENLTSIISTARAQGVERVILMGMRLPPNYGEAYVARFEAVYPKVAQALNVPLMPFLLEGVAGEPTLNLSDGIHPNAEGQRRVARSLLRFIEAEGLLPTPLSAPPLSDTPPSPEPTPRDHAPRPH